MPWTDPPTVKRRPWRRARIQDVYDELHSIRAFIAQLVSQGTTHSMQLAAIGTRLDSIEAQLGARDPNPPGVGWNPIPPGVADLDEARAARREHQDLA